MAIPNRILEEIKNSEVKAEDFYSIYGKENIDAAVEELIKSDREILNTYSVSDMHKAVSQKLSGNHTKEKASVYKFPAQKFIAYSAAAVLLAAIIVPAGLKNKTSISRIPVERVKGNADTLQNKAPQLKLYRQQGQEIQLLSNGDVVHSGDVIQITYNAGSSEYGVIFSVDGNGNIPRHFPDSSWQSAQLIHRNDDTPLDFSYELDNAPSFECFIMVTSKKQFNLEGLDEAIKNKTDIKYITELSYLPKRTKGTVFILGK